MRAHTHMNPFGGGYGDRAKYWKIHRRRVKQAEPTMKINSEEQQSSPRKDFVDRRKEIRKNEEKEKISKNNMKLAQEIFKIMDGPGMVSEILVKTYNNHPGTNNFGTRLTEAKRIHYENRFLASRLDNVQPYYQFTKLQNSPRKKTVTLKKPKAVTKRKNQYKSDAENATTPSSPRSIRTAPTGKRSDFSDDRKQQLSSAGGSRKGVEGDSRTKPKNLIMEHWKIQNGRVLDVAVLKEPFEDRFSLLGIDVDDGQRYQLSLSSEEVSNILEGDMLVTSFDNHNVWLALINKINLRPVMAFVKPGSAPVAVTASVNLVQGEPNTNGSTVASVVSSITGQPPHEREGSIASQEEVSYSEDWGSMMNMPAIDIPVTSYGPEPEYDDDAFEVVDDVGENSPKKSTKETEAGEIVTESRDDMSLPAIQLSISASDTSGVEAVPPPFDFPMTRPSRPITAGNRGSSTDVGDTAGSERKRLDSGRAVQPVSGVVEEAQSTDVSIVTTRSNSVTVSTAADAAKPGEATKPTQPTKPKDPAPSRRNSHMSPRKIIAGVRKLPKKESMPVVDVPWNSNVLVTKVRERMAEISAVEQEIAVKRRATEYKLKKEKAAHDELDVNGENSGVDAKSSVDSPQKVSFQPEPPSSLRPSALSGDPGNSFKSARGRRPTQFTSKQEQEEINITENTQVDSVEDATELGSSYKSARGRRSTRFPSKMEQDATTVETTLESGDIAQQELAPEIEREPMNEVEYADKVEEVETKNTAELIGGVEKELETEHPEEAVRAPSPVV